MAIMQTVTHTYTPDFYQVIGFITGMQEEPDFLDEVVDAWLSSGASDVHHPFVGRLVVLLPLVWRDVSEGDIIETNTKRSLDMYGGKFHVVHAVQRGPT